jgi:hypothetical protein
MLSRGAISRIMIFHRFFSVLSSYKNTDQRVLCGFVNRFNFAIKLMLQYPARDPLPNPIIVFDDLPPEFSRDDAPIMLSWRQPSFTDLGITPTPKGFRSLSDFQANQHRSRFHSLFGTVPRLTASELDFMGWRNRRPSQMPSCPTTDTEDQSLSD